MARLPALFISHGAPDLPIRTGPTQDFLRQLARTMPTPRAILVITAHWLTEQPMVSTTSQPRTIYDFGGFPAELYRLNYPAPGDSAIAQEIVQTLSAASIPVQTDPSRGFDHGTWTPLILAYPQADIPVIQLSVQPRLGAQHHWRLGQAIAPLRDQGILIIGSGAATHNLAAFAAGYDAAPPDWVLAFDDWLATSIQANDRQSLLNYRHLAPYAVQNHPSEEHLLPLFVALGAGDTERPGRQLHHGFTYGAFSMAAYAFDSCAYDSTLILNL